MTRMLPLEQKRRRPSRARSEDKPTSSATTRYNGRMCNKAYLRVWCTGFPEGKVIERFGAFLATVPYSSSRPGFTYFTVRAVDSAEAPILEQDLRPVPMDPAGILELTKDHLHSDCAYEAQTHWDAWIFNPATEPAFRSDPQPLELICRGEDYDDAAWRQDGHLQANLGFEHLFLGYAGLLGSDEPEQRVAETPEEARLLEAMAWPENLERYQEKTRANIRHLLEWARRVEKTLPEARVELWSEGEDNFEAKLKEILAAA